MLQTTSLHGNITALSYYVPHFCFNHILKAKSFIETWETNSSMFIIDIHNFASNIINFFKNPIMNDFDISAMKKKVYENFHNIFMMIKSDREL